MPVYVNDDFPGSSLNTDLWTAEKKIGTEGITVNNGLNLSLPQSALASARIISKAEIPATGSIIISASYTPGRREGGGSGVPYLALKQDGAARDANYHAPISNPMCTLGHYSNVTVLTALLFGVSGSAAYLTSPGNATVSLPINVECLIEWLVDWDNKVMGVTVNGVVKASNVAFVFTPTAPLRLEVANSCYNTGTARTEKYANVSVRTKSIFSLGGRVVNGTEEPLSRTIRFFNRATGVLKYTTSSDPVTGEFGQNVAAGQYDLQIMAEQGDTCDVFIPNRTPVETE